MANAIGTLLVELGVNTAHLKEGFDKATYMGKQFAGEMKRSFMELGGSISSLGRELGASFGPLGGAVDVVSSAFKTLGNVTAGVGKGVAPTLTAIVGASAGATAAILAVAAGYGIMAQEGHEAAEGLILASEKMGMSTDKLQVLKAAGESVNVPLQMMQMGMRRFATELSDMGVKNTKATDLLQKMGVTAKDPYNAMLQLADGIHKVEDPTKRMSDVITIFGARMGLSMLPLLEKGRAGIGEYADVVSEFGTKVTGNAVTATEQWKKETVSLSTAWEGFKLQFADSTWMNAGIKGLATSTAAMGKLLGHGDLTGFGVNAGGQKATPQDEAKAAKDAGLEKAQQAADAAASAAEKQYEWVKAGGAAAYELAQVQKRIKEDTEDSANADYKDAAIQAAKLPALEQAAKLEKERKDALMNLPKTTKEAVDSESVKMASAYAEALRAQGTAGMEAANEQESLATIQKFANKQIELGIASYPAAINALKQYSAAVRQTVEVTEGLKKAGEASKQLEELGKKSQEAVKSLDEEAGATSRIEKAQAALDKGLDEAKRALDEEGKAVVALREKYGQANPEVQKAQQLLGANTRALEKDTAEVEKNKEAIANKITAEALTKQGMLTEKTREYITLLGKEPEWLAKATAEATEQAHAIGLSGDALAKYVANATQAAALQRQQGAASGANQALYGKADQISQIQATISAIKQQAAAFESAGGSANMVNRALKEQEMNLLRIEASEGSYAAGFKLAFMEVRTGAQEMQQDLQKAISGFSNGISKCIVEGQSLGKAMKNVAKEILESMISWMVQYLIKYIALKVGIGAIDKTAAATNLATSLAADKAKVISAAGVAGAEGVASFSGAPWPVDMGAPAFGATMAAASLAFGAAEEGGLVGYDDMIIAAHKNEMVLPAPLSQKVQNMTEQGRGDTHVSVTYSPTVHAIDGKGMTQALNEHAHIIQAHVQKALRRTNK